MSRRYAEDDDDDDEEEQESSFEEEVAPRRRGRPRRSAATSSAAASKKTSGSRGRKAAPSKSKSKTKRAKSSASPKGRGKRKAQQESELDSDEEDELDEMDEDEVDDEDDDDDDDDEMDLDDDDIPDAATRRAIRRAASGRVLPSRNRRQVRRGADADAIRELLGSDDEEEEMDQAQRKKSRKTDLADLNAEMDVVLPVSEDSDRKLDVVLDRREAKGGTREYFVKWQNSSYLHCSWVPEHTLLGQRSTKNRLAKFNAHYDAIGGLMEDEPFPPEFTEVDRILDGRTNGEEVQYLIKWQSLGYEQCTWESAKYISDDLAMSRFEQWRVAPPLSKYARKERPPPKSWRKYEKSPKYENDNELRDYQLEGLNWLTFNWYHKRNTILADEMGLGKTVQAMSILNHLYSREDIIGPFLVVAPLSTIPHWKREFEGWTRMNAVVYHGTAAARNVIRKYEMYHRNAQTGKVMPNAPKFNVLITTYEMVLADAPLLKGFKWRYLVVDEAHRLKNQESKLMLELRTWHFEHVLLLTGTPLQNNTTELWSLLNFLNPDKYYSLPDFLDQYGDLTTTTQVEKLHALLRPIMLRRKKDDVEKAIAPLEETIVEVELTNSQKVYYKAVYERNFSYLAQGGKSGKGSVPSLINVVMQLRKCCNHPFLLTGVEEQIFKEENATTYEERMQALIKSSGKLVLIDKLLPRLKAQGHKILIFSQFVKVLDILQDYLDYRQFEYERIDGGIRGNDRQAAIDRFSREGSSKFVFLLGTRAGGVGINLTAADTVIIFDSDWNPQNDVQAQARCHRIGQKQMVKVYRLITRNTYEKDMFVRASKKLGLDQAVLNQLENAKEAAAQREKEFGPSAMKKDEIDSLLRHGAYDVFREGRDKPDVEYDEADIERILERDSTKITYSGPKQDALSSLSKASFVSGDADNQIDMEDPDFWKKLLPEHAQNFVDPNILHGSRSRRAAVRSTGVHEEELDELLGDEGDMDAASEDGEEYRLRAKVDAEPGIIVDHSTDWSLSSRARFRSALMAFGFGRWERIREAGKLNTSVDQVQAYAEAMVSQMCRVVDDEDVLGRFQIIDNSGNERYVPLAEMATREAVREYQARQQKKLLEGAGAFDEAATSGAVASATAVGSAAQAPEGAAATDAAATDAATPASAAEGAVDASKVSPVATSGDGNVEVPQGVEAEIKSILEDIPNYSNHWTLLGNDWESFLQRNSSIVLTKLTHTAVLGAHVRKYDCNLASLPKLGVVAPTNPPVTWWTEEMDNCVIMGSYRHGVGRYEEMWNDDELPFPNKKSTPDKPQPKHPEGNGGWEQLGQLFLNERTRRVIKKLLQRLDREERSQLREKKKPRRKPETSVTVAGVVEAEPGSRRAMLEQEWSKREKSDLYRTLSTWGVCVTKPPPELGPTVKNGSKIDWTYVIKEASLHKTPKQIEEFYGKMIRYCEIMTKDTLLTKNASISLHQTDGGIATNVAPEVEAQREELKKQLPEGVDLTSKQVQRLLQRLRMFVKLRCHIVPRGREDIDEWFEGSKVKTSKKGFPDWWTKSHDAALIFAVAKHGYFWEDICDDPEFPFYEIVKSKEGQGEEQKDADKKHDDAAAAAAVIGTNEEAAIKGEQQGEDEKKKEEDDDEGEDKGKDEAKDETGADSSAVAAGGAEEADGAAGGDEKSPSSSKKKKKPSVVYRRDRGRRCALVDWPKDGVLFKRFEALVDVLAEEKLWYMAEGIVGEATSSRKVKTTVVKPPTPTPTSAPAADDSSVKRRGTGGGDEDDDDFVDDVFTKPKRSTSRSKASSFKIPKQVQFDAEGKPIFPMQVSLAGTIVALGEVVYDRPAYHTDRYIWPVGFKSTRRYNSTKDIREKTFYTCEICDGGDHPIFKITGEDLDEPIEAASATTAWHELINQCNQHATRSGNTRQLSNVSGPEYFGVSNPFVMKLIQELPNADKLTNYKRVAFPENRSSSASKAKRRKVVMEEIEPEYEDAWRMSAAAPDDENADGADEDKVKEDAENADEKDAALATQQRGDASELVVRFNVKMPETPVAADAAAASEADGPQPMDIEPKDGDNVKDKEPEKIDVVAEEKNEFGKRPAPTEEASAQPPAVEPAAAPALIVEPPAAKVAKAEEELVIDL